MQTKNNKTGLLKKKYTLVTVVAIALLSAILSFTLGQWQGKNQGYMESVYEENQLKRREKLKYKVTIKSLLVQNLPAIDYYSIFSRQHLLEADIKDFDDFFTFAHKRYKSFEPLLKDKWGIQDEKKLRGIFFMNLVSSMWGYGNKVHEDKTPGCVPINENTGFKKIPKEKLTIRTYLESGIGCCSDNAELLQFLLEKSGIKQRKLFLSGHVVNEVYFAGGWYTLDATANMMLHFPLGKLNDMHKRKEKIKVTIFPHNNCVYNNNPFYRAKIGQFRIQLLLSLIHRSIEYLEVQ